MAKDQTTRSSTMDFPDGGLTAGDDGLVDLAKGLYD